MCVPYPGRVPVACTAAGVISSCRPVARNRVCESAASDAPALSCPCPALVLPRRHRSGRLLPGCLSVAWRWFTARGAARVHTTSGFPPPPPLSVYCRERKGVRLPHGASEHVASGGRLSDGSFGGAAKPVQAAMRRCLLFKERRVCGQVCPLALASLSPPSSSSQLLGLDLSGLRAVCQLPDTRSAASSSSADSSSSFLSTIANAGAGQNDRTKHPTHSD